MTRHTRRQRQRTPSKANAKPTTLIQEIPHLYRQHRSEDFPQFEHALQMYLQDIPAKMHKPFLCKLNPNAKPSQSVKQIIRLLWDDTHTRFMPGFNWWRAISAFMVTSTGGVLGWDYVNTNHSYMFNFVNPKDRSWLDTLQTNSAISAGALAGYLAGQSTRTPYLKNTKRRNTHQSWETLSTTTKIRDVKRTFQQDLSNNLLDSKDWPPERIQRARKRIPIYVKRYPTVDSPGSIVRMIVEDN